MAEIGKMFFFFFEIWIESIYRKSRKKFGWYFCRYFWNNSIFLRSVAGFYHFFKIPKIGFVDQDAEISTNWSKHFAKQKTCLCNFSVKSFPSILIIQKQWIRRSCPPPRKNGPFCPGGGRKNFSLFFALKKTVIFLFSKKYMKNIFFYFFLTQRDIFLFFLFTFLTLENNLYV